MGLPEWCASTAMMFRPDWRKVAEEIGDGRTEIGGSYAPIFVPEVDSHTSRLLLLLPCIYHYRDLTDPRKLRGVLGSGKEGYKMRRREKMEVMFEDLRNTGDAHWRASSGVAPSQTSLSCDNSQNN